MKLLCPKWGTESCPSTLDETLRCCCVCAVGHGGLGLDLDHRGGQTSPGPANRFLQRVDRFVQVGPGVSATGSQYVYRPKQIVWLAILKVSLLHCLGRVAGGVEQGEELLLSTPIAKPIDSIAPTNVVCPVTQCVVLGSVALIASRNRETAAWCRTSRAASGRYWAGHSTRAGTKPS